MEPLGQKIRDARLRLGLTLDQLAGRTQISKPYLSLIETGRVANPPADSKLRRLEQSLGFATGELVGQAHLLRTPRDIRAMLSVLAGQGIEQPDSARAGPPAENRGEVDAALLGGILRDLVGQQGMAIERVRVNAVPIINRRSAGYPSDFLDLAYPRAVADDFIGCPDLNDPAAFAARVHGDSMEPRFAEGDIVLFSPAVAVRTGDDCFVRFADGRTTFRRVFFEQTEAGEPILRLQPRNEIYRPTTAQAHEVAGTYRAAYRFEAL